MSNPETVEIVSQEYEAKLKAQQEEYEAKLKAQQEEYEAKLKAQQEEHTKDIRALFAGRQELPNNTNIEEEEKSEEDLIIENLRKKHNILK